MRVIAHLSDLHFGRLDQAILPALKAAVCAAKPDVVVVSGDLTQIDEVRSGGSYLSQNDLRLHFGFEKRTKIDLLEVRWPSGIVDKISNANVNKILTVKEGQGLVDQKDFKSSLRR